RGGGRGRWACRRGAGGRPARQAHPRRQAREAALRAGGGRRRRGGHHRRREPARRARTRQHGRAGRRPRRFRQAPRRRGGRGDGARPRRRGRHGVTLDRLWNGWRAAYVAGHGVDRRLVEAVDADDAELAAASVFTRILRSGLSDEEAHIVHRGERCFAIMNAFPYTSGHVLVLPYREVAELEDLDADETTELWATVTEAVRVLKATYRPEGLNVGINLGQPAGGSISQHLHVHVVPRWA